MMQSGRVQRRGICYAGADQGHVMALELWTKPCLAQAMLEVSPCD